jgi:hypothetical protein
MDKLSTQGGPVIQHAVAQPVFWGSAWDDSVAHQTATTLVDDLTHLMEGPYMLGLSQYGGVGPPSVLSPVFDSASEPPEPVTLEVLGGYIKALIAASSVLDFRSNDQLLYCIFTNGRAIDIPNADGYHYFDELDGKRFHYAWMSRADSGLASHEIIEACTDPEGNGFTQKENGIEAADICEDNPDAEGFVDGIAASSYWSNADSRCILPRRTAKLDMSMDDCRIGPSVGTQTTFTLSLGVDPSWIDGSHLALPNARFSWKFDHRFANSPVLNPKGPQLVLSWLEATSAPTEIAVTLRADPEIQLSASIHVGVRSRADAVILHETCSLRKILSEIQRIPPFLINPAGPDPVALPTQQDLQELDSLARRAAQSVTKIKDLMGAGAR